jgi:hypothetical protein
VISEVQLIHSNTVLVLGREAFVFVPRLVQALSNQFDLYFSWGLP